MHTEMMRSTVPPTEIIRPIATGENWIAGDLDDSDVKSGASVVNDTVVESVWKTEAEIMVG